MTVSIRRGLLAAVSAIALTISVAPTLHAQEATLSADAELASKGNWSPSTTYARDDIVTARGSAWISRRAGNKNKVPGQTNPSSATFWQLFARGFNPTGAWVNTTKYQPDDLVTFNGQTFRAKVTHANRQPAANQFWELLAAKGAAGPNTGIGAGTASVPSISFSGDPNTGIFSPGADKIAIVEGGQLFLHNTGTGNTALGLNSLGVNTGVSNTALGTSALAANTTGQENTAVGTSALLNNTDGQHNIAVGTRALAAVVSNQRNTAVGYEALKAATTNENTAVGFQALTGNTSGSRNTALGSGAMVGNTTGASNVAVGTTALVFGGGSFNVAVGDSAMFGTSTGAENVAIGVQALDSNVSGSGNIAVGRSAGANPTAPANSIFIGNEGLAADTTTIKIGTQGTHLSTFIAGISNASVGGSNVQVFIDTTTGQLGGPPASSGRFKEDIQAMGDVTAILDQLRPVTFRYKASETGGSKPLHYGLIAEEVAEVMPYLAVFNPDGTLRTVHYERLPTFLLAGYQAQQKTIAAQAARDDEQQRTITSQAEKIDALEARLRRLEALLPQTKAASLQ